MRPRIVLFSLLLGLTAMALPHTGRAEADGSLPPQFGGEWFSGSNCSDVSGYYFIGHAAMVYVFQDEDERDYGSVVSPVSVLATEPGSSVIVTYGKQRHAWKLEPSGLDDRLVTDPTSTMHLIRCTNPRVNGTTWAFYASYLRGVTGTLTSLDRISANCGSDEQACTAALMRALDLNKDGKISRAEIVAFLRAAAKLAPLLNEVDTKSGAMVSSFSTAAIPGIELGTATFGPFIARLVMDNIDYDGDGFIEPAELGIFLDQFGLPQPAGGAAELIFAFQDHAARAVQSLQALQQLLSTLGSR